MATTTETIPVTIPLVSISDPETRVSEVQNVAGALQYDDSGPTYTDFTTEANSDAAGDVDIWPAVAADGDAFPVGAAVKFDWVCFKIETATR